MKQRRVLDERTKISIAVSLAVLIISSVLYLYEVVCLGNDTSFSGDCEMHFVDVGQGDCTLIITEDNAVLIDAGPNEYADRAERYVSSYTDTIDYFILTHPHEDHIGGADEILRSVRVENVILSDASSDTLAFTRMLDAIEESGCNVIEASVNDTFTAGDIKLTILSPMGNFTDYNDYSIVTRVDYGKTSAIITGDVEHNSESLMVSRYGMFGLDADILQIAHHGSSTSNSEAFIDAVSPEFAVIQCGEGNTYGHPHRETLKKLNDRNISYYRTDEDGNVVFVSDGREVTLKGQ